MAYNLSRLYHRPCISIIVNIISKKPSKGDSTKITVISTLKRSNEIIKYREVKYVYLSSSYLNLGICNLRPK